MELKSGYNQKNPTTKIPCKKIRIVRNIGYLSIGETKKAREALVESNKLDPKKKETKELIKIIDEELGNVNANTSKRTTVNTQSGQKNK